MRVVCTCMYSSCNISVCTRTRVRVRVCVRANLVGAARLAHGDN